jgi:phosphatidylglycerophosphatase A
MMVTAKLISTCLGIGYIQKGAGTIAAAVCCVAWYFIGAGGLNAWYTLLGILLLFIIGLWASAYVELEWGHDSNRVVVDELLGMSVSMFLLPVNWKYIGLAFLLFRFFDIVKPLYIRKAEALPGGWGVMADDLLAGIYSNLLLHAALKTELF